MNRTLWMIGILGSTIALGLPAIAQISSDGSIGTIVNQTGNQFDITGGVTVGGRNLFHSFDRFDVPNQGAANFLNDPSIVNIFSRVTGGKVSEIDGVLRSSGSANFFLMNPSGIVFGKDASLDVGGSFIATTANAIRFSTDGEFSTTSTVDAQNRLLTVDPSAFLFNQLPIGQIENRSRADAGLYPASSSSLFGLKVKESRSLILLGGNVLVESGGLIALNGHIDIGGTGMGEIGLLKNNGVLRLEFPKEAAQADVSLSNEAGIIVAANQKGSVAINARNIQLVEGSTVEAGIGSKLGEIGSVAGEISIQANQDLLISGNSYISNQVSDEAIGEGGNIRVQAKFISLESAGQISTGTLGNGNSGNVIVNADDQVRIVGFLPREEGFISSALFARAERGSQGNAGNVTVNARQVLIQDGAQISTRSRGLGRAGEITINAKDSVELIGALPNSAIRSRIISAGFSSSEQGGSITIDTARFVVKDGAIAVTSTFGDGQAGNLTVNASQSVELIGAIDSNRSSLFSETRGTGKAGNLTISTNLLSIQNGAIVSTSSASDGQAGNLIVNADTVRLDGISTDENSRSALAAETSGEGNAANLIIQARNLFIQNGAVISTVSTGQGTGGNVSISADMVKLIGTSPNGFRSAISSETGDVDIGGNAGSVSLNSNVLSLENGAIISSSTFGRGRGGNVDITAKTIELSGISENNQFRSAIASETSGEAAQGDAGTITINTEKFRLINQGIVSTATFSRGKGGNLEINADNILLLNDSRITATSGSEGKAGSLEIRANQDINLRNSQIAAEAQQTGGGSITVTGRYIILRENSRIRTDLATGQARGGNIDLTADGIVALENSDILAFAPEGTGGNITFNTRAFLSQPLYRPNFARLVKSDLEALFDNNRVDVNASGAVSGAINGVPNITFLQNSLAQLSQNAIDTNALLANSCITRNEQNGTFFITGKGGLPTTPGDLSNYPTSTIQSTENWKRGDAIVEPQGVYQLPNGDLILSRECS